MTTRPLTDPHAPSFPAPPRRPREYPARLTVRSVGRIQLLETADIEWLAGAGNYVEICTGGQSVLHREPLHALEHRLDPALFVRIHRSAIVRRTSVREIRTISHGYHIVACDRRSFRLGRTYRAALALLGDVGSSAPPSDEPTLTAQPRSGRAW
ncbi:MAG: LytTR family DNA-binding domain-containing protein [Kofleriaceae bacterium]